MTKALPLKQVASIHSEYLSALGDSVCNNFIQGLIQGLAADDAEAVDIVRTVLAVDESVTYSWLLESGAQYPYLILDIMAEAIRSHPRVKARITDALVMSLGSACANIPFDFAHICLDFMIQEGLSLNAEQINFLTDHMLQFEDWGERGIEECVLTKTDGIDHLFPIPETSAAKIELVETAAAYARAQNRALLIAQALKLFSKDSEPRITLSFMDRSSRQSPYDSAYARSFIAKDVGSTLIQPEHYLVRWNSRMARTQDTFLSLAEILRIILLDPIFSLPDIQTRPAVLRFYRQCLRFSGRSIVGLKAGVFFVEHGLEARPSYIYVGRDAVLGKGCLIDGVGGCVIGRGAFLGGGFMPILIHTHKHISSDTHRGVHERRRVNPALFVAEAYARLPMTATGLFETHDYIGKATPYRGILGVELNG